MSTPKSIPLFHGRATPEMERAATEVLRSGQIASGPKVDEFQRRLSGLVAGRPMICTNDMTSALALALRLAGVQTGDEVPTLAYSCMSSNSPIAMVSAKAVWVDIEPSTASMSVADLERVLSPRTKAVMLYHVAGYPGPATEIRALCQARGITLVEDCNNALGASRHGVPVGAVADYAVWSFYPNRQINALEGGALACPDTTVASRALRLRRFGIDSTTFRNAIGEINPGSDIPEIGMSAGFSQLNAAVGLTQFDGLAIRLEKTRRNAAQLRAELTGIDGIEPVQALDGALPVHWGFLALADRRNELLAHLTRAGIGASKLHQRNDSYTGFHAIQRALPGTDELMRRVIALPCGWWLEPDDISYVATAVRTCLR